MDNSLLNDILVGIKQLQTEQEEMKKDIQQLQTGQEEMKKDIVNLTRYSSNASNLIGSIFESTVNMTFIILIYKLNFFSFQLGQ